MNASARLNATGRELLRPITSERARLVPHVLNEEGLTIEEALAAGRVTLRAVAVAYYGGDMARAKAAIYGEDERAT